MKKIEVLLWGVKHIAQNHGFDYSTEYEDDGEVCIFGGCNVPTLEDVMLLCEDLGIERNNVESSDFGIDIWMDWRWMEEDNETRNHQEGKWGMLLEEYKPTGMEMWKRFGVEIGS